MAKKKTGKVIQMLSPENYIRKKARSLPIHECLVNEEWQEQGFANLVIARIHTNGNITACIYLVDLYCLGVKDTHYLFNSTRLNYHEKIGGNDKINYTPISYTLAHNIVYAGLEFAEEYGFKPHKDFTSITRFMLEEDTEDVEMIDIECGKDGKPFYVGGPFDDDLKIRKIVAQLEKTAGAGNYDYILPGSEDEYDEDDEDDNFDELSYEEKRDLFLDLYARQEDLDVDETDQLDRLIDHIVGNVSDSDLVNQFSEEYLDDFDFELTQDEVTGEMLGIHDQSIDKKTGQLFLDTFSIANKDSDKARNLLKKFRNDTPENPASYFLELIILREEDSSNYSETLLKYHSKFPEYPLLRVLKANADFFDDEIDVEKTLENYTMQSIFAGRTTIHNMEAFNFLSVLFLGVFRLGDLDRLEGLYEASMNLEFSDTEFELFEHLVFMVKANFIKNLFSMA